MTLVNELNRRMLLSTLKFAEVKNAILDYGNYYGFTKIYFRQDNR